MDGEVKEKLEVKKKSGVTLILKGIPTRVNQRIKTYQRKISAERGKKFNLKTSYVEFLKEATKSIK